VLLIVSVPTVARAGPARSYADLRPSRGSNDSSSIMPISIRSRSRGVHAIITPHRGRRRTLADRALAGGASLRRAHSSWYSFQ
jgi:hypothetical protein